jgi:phosphate transport system protein
VSLLAVADVPREHRAASYDGPDDRGEERLRRRIHTSMVRVDFTVSSPRSRLLRNVHPAFTSQPRLVTSLTYGRVMREAFHQQLESMFGDLAEICENVESAVRLATEALLTGDASTAEKVITGDVEIDRARERVEDSAFMLLSLQQPVASDLRTVVAALRMVSELERMGDLSVHVAKIARLRVPNLAVPDDVRPTIEQMALVAEDMVRRVSKVIVDRDVDEAVSLTHADEEMDGLRRSSFTELLSADWSHGVEAAVDIALLGRYYERIADHAVSVANRVVFVVTGENPASVDA